MPAYRLFRYFEGRSQPVGVRPCGPLLAISPQVIARRALPGERPSSVAVLRGVHLELGDLRRRDPCALELLAELVLQEPIKVRT